jgi:hypothetical protein
MPRLIAPLALAILLVAAPARATSFTLSSFNVNYNQSGIALSWTSLLGGPLTFSLANVGQTFTTNLFQIGTTQTSLNVQSVIPHPISVGLNFSAPPPGFSGAGYGLTGAGWFFGNFGYVAWNNPAVMSFGTTGLLGVSLSSVAFPMPGSASVIAKFQLLRANTPTATSVSEPSSAVLTLAGLILTMVGVRRTRQRS